MAQWVADKLSGNKQRRGGSSAHHVVKGPLDTLVRETLQNSKDQSVNGLVEVKYTLISMTGQAKAKFLKAMDWGVLKDHLEAATNDPGAITAKLRSGIAETESKKALICLRIDDLGARGLDGGEFERAKNFNLLCRAEFQTSSLAGRGGSYGLGKAVLWRYSEISTVLLSSIVEGEGAKGLRLFGRADIPAHDLKSGDEFDSGAWFGERKTGKDGVFASSIWGDDALASSLHLARASGVSGTTALIVALYEPEEDQSRGLPEIAQDILHSAERWFWPCMAGSNATLAVAAQVIEDGKQTFIGKADPTTRWEPFIRAKTGVVNAKAAKQPADVVEGALIFNVPAKEQPLSEAHAEASSSLTLRVTRGTDKDGEHEQANCVAVFRGAEMVVRYVPARRRPLDASCHVENRSSRVLL